jgi:guanosine-3',5'-bis(diphosphate) 3'-pyrophosphohydrolase
VTLDVTITNDAGVLGRICTLIGEQKANISDLHFMDRKPDFYRLLIDVDLRDAEHLHRGHDRRSRPKGTSPVQALTRDPNP